MAVDMVEFNQLEEIEEDYILEDFFPTPLPYPLQPLIEYRKIAKKCATLKV